MSWSASSARPATARSSSCKPTRAKRRSSGSIWRKNRIRLEPANSTMKPIYVKHAKMLGVVVGVVRKVD